MAESRSFNNVNWKLCVFLQLFILLPCVVAGSSYKMAKVSPNNSRLTFPQFGNSSKESSLSQEFQKKSQEWSTGLGWREQLSLNLEAWILGLPPELWAGINPKQSTCPERFPKEDQSAFQKEEEWMLDGQNQVCLKRIWERRKGNSQKRSMENVMK